MGDNTANTTGFDLDDNNRIQNGTIEIGPYEYNGPECILYTTGVVYVDSTATGLNDGTSWANAFNLVQDALEVAFFCDVDTIKVAQGTYYPGTYDTVSSCTGISITTPSREDFFFIPDDIVMLGGYKSGGSEETWRDWYCYATILSGDINHDGDSAGNVHHVVKTMDYDSCIMVDGFIIEQGNAVGHHEGGGGWWDGSTADSAKLVIRNTTFRNNFAYSGGGFYGTGTRDLFIHHSVFHLSLIHI